MTVNFKQHARSTKIQKDAMNAMSDLIMAINQMGEERAVVNGATDALLNSHRTLQQGTIAMLFKVIDNVGKQQYFDPRNEAAVTACRKVSQFIEDENIYFPFI